MALLSGLAIAAAFPRLEWWPLAWAALVPVLWAVEGRGLRATFLLGLTAGFVANVVGFFWMNEMLVTFGHLPMVVSVPLVALGAAYQGLSIGAAFASTRYVRGWFPTAGLLLLPVFYTAAEAFHPILFPWYLGNCQYRVLPLIQVADLFGVESVTFLVVCGNVAVYAAATRLRERFAFGTRRRGDAARGTVVPPSEPGGRVGAFRHGPVFLLSLAPLVAAALYGTWRLDEVEEEAAAADSLRVAVVEPEIGIFQEQRKEFPAGSSVLSIFRWNTLELHRASQALAPQSPDLIVWPESMYFPAVAVSAKKPGETAFAKHYYWLPDDATEVYQSSVPLPKAKSFPAAVVEDSANDEADINSVQRGFFIPLLFGATSGEAVDLENPSSPRNTRYNSAFLLDSAGKVLGRYDKQYRLAFGEYIPLGDTFPFLYDLIPESGHFSKGPARSPLLLGEHRLGVLICYEDILVGHTRNIASQGTDVLVNLTNDAWFGKTQEPKQHFILSLFRAIEHRRALVRSTTTGISGVVSPSGRILKITDPQRAETFVENVPLMSGTTVYSQWGYLFPYALLAGSVAALVAAGLERKRGGK